MNSQEFERKLSAILSADVVGYSRLMGEDEDHTIHTLTGHREMMSRLIHEHKGRVVDSPGDNLLAVFSSVTRAVNCAVEIQRELSERNAELLEDRKMEYRIGVNLGDVVEEGERVYGDGVNIAARLESLAAPGGVCISGFVYNQVKNRLKLEYEFIGEHSVKNIKEPVRVYRIRIEPESVAPIVKENKARLRTWQWVALAVVVSFILGAVATWYLYFHQAPVANVVEEAPKIEQTSVLSDIEEAPKTIAVIPFVNLSPDPEQEYFVDGLSEELLNCLTQIDDLSVTSRTSSFAFKGTDKKIHEIANELGVEHILEGSVRKAGNELRITAQLVRARDDRHLWSQTYDRELKDIFAVQEDIATSVADELKAKLGIDRSLRPLGGTDNVEAYELFLSALGTAYQAMLEWKPENLSRCLKLIDAAIVIDPNFASAWIEKMYIHWPRIFFMPANLVVSDADEVIRAAIRAVELEPNLAAGNYSLGAARMIRGDLVEAGLAYRKAMELKA